MSNGITIKLPFLSLFTVMTLRVLTGRAIIQALIFFCDGPDIVIIR